MASGLKVTKTDAEKRIEAQQKALEKSIAEQNKQAEELTEAQKGLSKKFQTLTSKLGNSDKSLATTAANLRKGTKETFSGMLASRGLAKKLEEVEKDPAFIQAQALVEDRNRDLAISNKVQDDNLNEQQAALEDARNSNKELKELYKIQEDSKKQLAKTLEGDDAGKMREANGRIITELEANLKAQKETADAQSLIDAKEQKVKDQYTATIEAQTLAIENQTHNLEVAVADEGKIRDELADDLKDSTTSEGFDNFNSSLKGLTGGAIDVGGAFDSIIKFGMNLWGVLKGVSAAMAFFGLQMPKFVTKLKDRITKGPAQSTEGVGEVLGPVRQRLKKDGTKDKRFKVNRPPPKIGIMQRLGDGMKGLGKGLGKAFNALKLGMKGVGKIMLKVGKGLLKAVARLALGAGLFLLGLLGTAIGMMVAALPFIAIALGIGLVIGVVVASIKALMNAFPIIGETLTAIKDWVLEKVQVLWDFISTLDFSAVTEMFTNMWASIKEIFSGLVDFFSAAFKGDFEGMFTAVKKIFSAIIDYIKAPFVAIGKFFSDNKADDPLDAAEESGLYDKKGVGLLGNKESIVDMKKAKSASTEQLQSILDDGDLSEEQSTQLQAMVDKRPLTPVEPTTGKSIEDGTTEVNEGAKKGAGGSSVVMANSADNSSVNTQNTSVTTVSPRDGDGTVGRLNLATA